MFAFLRTLVIGNSWLTTNPLIHTQWFAPNTFGFFNDVRIFCYRNSVFVIKIWRQIVPHAALIRAQSGWNAPKQNPFRICEANTETNREYFSWATSQTRCAGEAGAGVAHWRSALGSNSRALGFTVDRIFLWTRPVLNLLFRLAACRYG